MEVNGTAGLNMCQVVVDSGMMGGSNNRASVNFLVIEAHLELVMIEVLKLHSS